MALLLCTWDDTVTTRAEPSAFSSSSSRFVNRYGARWLTASCISMPSTVTRLRLGMMPALLMRTPSSGYCALSDLASLRIDPWEERSAIIRSTRRLPEFSLIVARAASPRSRLRHTITTTAPIRASPSAVALPMPAFAPVTTHTFPYMLDGSIASHCTTISQRVKSLRPLVASSAG